MYRFLNAVGEDSVDCPRDDCWGMNPCCVVFTPNQLNIITFHFSGLNLLYLACITNDRKAQANTDVFFFFPTLILAYEPWKWKIKTAVLMELSWLWCSLFQMWLNPICIHDITRCRCVLPFSSFIEKTENLCFKIYLIYKIHLYNSTNDVEQKAMWNIQPSHIQCVTSRQIKGERSCYMYIYFHPPFSSIANTCMGTRILVRLKNSLGVSAFYFDSVHRYCAVPWQHPNPHQDSQISFPGDKLGINSSHQVHTSSFPLLVESRWCFPWAWHLVIISWLWFKDPIFAVELNWLWSYRMWGSIKAIGLWINCK